MQMFAGEYTVHLCRDVWRYLHQHLTVKLQHAWNQSSALCHVCIACCINFHNMQPPFDWSAWHQEQIQWIIQCKSIDLQEHCTLNVLLAIKICCAYLLWEDVFVEALQCLQSGLSVWEEVTQSDTVPQMGNLAKRNLLKGKTFLDWRGGYEKQICVFLHFVVCLHLWFCHSTEEEQWNPRQTTLLQRSEGWNQQNVVLLHQCLFPVLVV